VQRNLLFVHAAVIAALIATSTDCLAQEKCFEGRTKSGACVDASLASMMRQAGRVLTQPRLSYSGPAVAPSADRRYDALRDWGQGLSREIYGPCGVNSCP
jgi:hypothetical protein